MAERRRGEQEKKEKEEGKRERNAGREAIINVDGAGEGRAIYMKRGRRRRGTETRCEEMLSS